MTLARIAATTAAVALAAATAAPTRAGAQEKEVTIASWGGSYQDAQSKALFQPASKATGIKVNEETYGGMSDVRLQVQTGVVTYDIVVSGTGSAARAAEEGLLEKLDYNVIDVSHFPDSAYTDYCIGGDVFSTVMAWNTKTYGEDGPKSWADFWDVEKFPGTRAYRGKVAGARARSDGRRRAARKGLRGPVHRGGHRPRDRQDPRAEASHRRLVGLGRAARPAHEGWRGRHDDRLERPVRRRGRGWRPCRC